MNVTGLIPIGASAEQVIVVTREMTVAHFVTSATVPVPAMPYTVASRIWTVSTPLTNAPVASNFHAPDIR